MGSGADAQPTITKPRSVVRPNVADYAAARASFDWAAARRELAGLPAGGINIAHEAVDRHADGPRADHVALRFVGRSGAVRDLTYRDLRERTARFANALTGLGVGAGERVFVLAPRRPDLYVAVLGALRARAVVSPLFPSFGPEPVRQRVSLGAGAVLVTTPELYERRVAPVRRELPGLRHVVLIEAEDAALPEGGHDMGALLAAASPVHHIPPTDPEDLALLHFTSGTTGTPKGAMHVHAAVAAHRATALAALDLHPEDVFWCTADPGWVTGMSYGIIAPLTLGVTSVVDEAEFDPERWVSLLRDQRVSVWYTAPTAVRMLMREGASPASGDGLPDLRFVASVGEPLNPEAVHWGVEALGLPIHDNWWQTETGAIMIANLAALPIRPGSMGLPLPGVEAAVLRAGPDGRPVPAGDDAELAQTGEPGLLALRPGWPSMFRGYLGQDERYAACFAQGWYLSGDLASRDADGYLWFVGRGDDVITSAGHLIGPFEVESVLIEHPSVAEAAVIGLPDPTMGEVVMGFVSLVPGAEPSDRLAREIRGHARARLGPAVAPRAIAFRERLPRTRSGKIMRRLLRARELGEPEGDLSTLEQDT